MTYTEIAAKFAELLVVAKSRGYDVDDLNLTNTIKMRPSTLGQFHPKQWMVAVDMHYASEMGTSYTEVIAHEIAHAIQRRYYRDAKQAHGKEFRMIMTRVFDVDGSATRVLPNTVKMKPVRAVTKTRHIYTCGCEGYEHKITTTLHKKAMAALEVLGNTRRRCNQCHKLIIPTYKVYKFI